MKKHLSGIFYCSFIVAALSLSGCRLGNEQSEISKDGLYNMPENTILTCSDGIDNDGDTLIDCDDPDCHEMGTAEVPGPGATVCPLTENNIYVCADGIDNDGNGYIDCEDNSCKQTAVCCIPTGLENSLEECSDGIDNNCNGYIDCADNSCMKTSKGAAPEAIVYCQALKCPAGIEDENTLETCSDGIDNDCNGYIDCQDNSCRKSSDPRVVEYCKRVNCPYLPTDENGNVVTSEENTLETCSDGIDNDCDGYTDCASKSCKNSSDPAVVAYCKRINCPELPVDDKGNVITSAENTIETCSDGIDNDCNGYIDCQDNSCKKTDYCIKVNCPDIVDKDGNINKVAENTEETCSDGIDNDCNGFIDCQDNNCKTTRYCQSQTCVLDESGNVVKSAEDTYEACTDGKDNDCNGWIDCQDNSCKNSTDARIQAYCNGNGSAGTDVDYSDVPTPNAVPETTPELCSDGKDNDFNGLADCADPNCIALNLEYCSVALTKEPPARPENFAELSANERAAILANEKHICTDGIDNDRNGLVDCAEYNCQMLSIKSQKYTGDDAKYKFDCQTSNK